MTTPEQLAKRREDAEKFFQADLDGWSNESECYIAGYLRATQETEQAMNLMEKAANISAQHARKQALEEVIAICYAADFNENKYDIAPRIEELLK